MARNWKFSTTQDAWNRDFNSAPSSLPAANTTPSVSQPTQPLPMPKTVTPQPQSELDRYNQNFMKGGFLSKATDILSYPSMKVEQFLTGGKGYEKTFSKYTGENKPGQLDWNDAASFGSRLIADPLNFIPVGKIVGLAGKAATKAPFIAKAASKLDDVAKLIKATPAAKYVGSKFIKGYGVPKDVVEATDAVAPKVASATEDIVENLKKIFKGFSKQEKEAVATFLEPQNVAKDVDLAKLKASFGDRWKVIQDALHQVKQINKELVIDAAQRGNIKNTADMTSTLVQRVIGKEGDQLPLIAEKTKIPNMSKKAMSSVEELYRRPYYYRVSEGKDKSFLKKAMDFFTPGKELPKEAGVKFPGKKLGISGGYWKDRTGGAFSKNAPMSIAKRQVEQARDNVIQDVLNSTAGKYGKEIVDGAIPEGYRKLKPSRDAKQFYEKFSNMAFPKNVADHLEQTYSNSGGLGQFIDTFHRYWKQTATSYNPSFSINNLIGNLYNGAYLGGVKSPKRIAQMIKGGFTEAEKNLIKKSGILKEGEIPAQIIDNAFRKGKAPIGRSMQQLARNVENNGRSGLFLDAFEKARKAGADEATAIKQAADKVGEFMFNYQSALTPFESRQMKRIAPFYTWAKKNAQLQTKALINQTGKQANTLKAIRAVNSGETPDDLSIPTPMKDKKTGENLRYRLQLPIQSIVDVAGKGGETARDMISPGIKLPIELARSLMSGKAPIDYYSGKEITSPSLPKSMQAGDWAKYLATSLLKPARTLQKVAKDPTDFMSAARAILGGFSVDQGKDGKVSNKDYELNQKKKDLQTQLNKAIKDGDLNRAKKIEQTLINLK